MPTKKVTKKVASSTLELVQGDITAQDTDAVVNAANARLAPGGGVAGAIHRRAGPKLWDECRTLGGCATGEAKLTKGYDLRAPYVIHTVGPVYGSSGDDAGLLAASYRNSLELAVEQGLKSVAFPALSTGYFGYPIREAASIAFDTVIAFLKRQATIELVRFVLHSAEAFAIHEATLEKHL